jgi:molecular chaperone DnaJ
MDYYQVLGVSRDADERDIKRAYRRLARQYHPDVNGGSAEATEKFKQISEAYVVLSDSHKRRRYDAGGVDFDFGFGTAGMGSIFDIFNQAFGFAGGGSRWATPGRDLEEHVYIELEEVLTGAQRRIEYRHIATCEACGGTGAAPGSSPAVCSTCGGHGQVRQRQQTILGTMATVVTCPDCGGTGQSIEDPCTECGGTGSAPVTEELEINIPPGIRDGQHLEYPEKGDLSPQGGPPGNLYVRIHVAEHDTFTRHNNHLHIFLDISFAQAALGDTITVPTLEGETELKISPGIQSGEELRLSGKGLPDLRNSRRGDQVISVRVKTPTQLTEAQVELLHQLAAEEGLELKSPADPTIFDRVKKAFGGG